MPINFRFSPVARCCNNRQSQCASSALRSPQRGDPRSRARLHSTDRNRNETALGADGSLVPLIRSGSHQRERRLTLAAGASEQPMSRDDSCPSPCPCPRQVSRACLFALGLLSVRSRRDRKKASLLCQANVSWYNEAF